MKVRLLQIARAYPIPVLALIGLTLGGVLQIVFGRNSLTEWIWFFTLVAGGIPLVWNTVKGIYHKQFAADIVATLAIIAAILLNQAFAGVIVVLMQSGGEAIENYGLRRATSTLDALLARAPRIARRRDIENNVVEEIEARSVRIGDTLVVRQGDLIPVDGTIVSGNAEIDESALTGEPLPRSKSQGDKVLSGSVSAEGGFEMRADKLSEESQYAKIVALVRKAQEEKPPIQRLADRYAVWFTPLTLIVSAIGFLITLNPVTVLSVLVVATPCPLILATPIAVISSVNRAAQEGIIVKGGAAIEQIGRAQAAAFDKTGTITYGTPVLEKIIPLDDRSEDELLLGAASVDQFSSHIIAKTLVLEAQKRFGHLETVSDYAEAAGLGASGLVKGEHVAVGSRKFIDMILKRFSQAKDPPSERHVQAQDIPDFRAESGKMTAYVAINGALAGAIVFADQIRLGARETVQRLHVLGVKETFLITGDNLENALSIARQAGIDNVEANLLPEQKVELVHILGKKYETTVMVGDGINDAPALATATVGVAMGAHGTGISAEAADMVLLVDDVTKVAEAVHIGQRMLRIAKQGIFVGLGLSLAFMMVAAFGIIPPAIGAMMQEAVDAAVILNALRAR